MTVNLSGDTMNFHEKGGSYYSRLKGVVTREAHTSERANMLLNMDDEKAKYFKKSANVEKVDAWFNGLAETDDEGNKFLGLDGIVAFAEALEIDPSSDPAILVISFYCQAVEQMYFSREEFAGGMGRLQVSSVAELKSKLSNLRESLSLAESSATYMKTFWKYLFFYFKENEQKKTLTVEMCIAVIDIVLEPVWPLWSTLKVYFQAISEKACFDMPRTQTIGLDTWTQLLNFAHKYPRNVDGFDADDFFWPSILDSFCEEYVPQCGYTSGAGEKK